MTAIVCIRLSRRWNWSRASQRPGSTRPSSWPRDSASIHGAPTRLSAARSRCQRAPGDSYASLSSPRRAGRRGACRGRRHCGTDDLVLRIEKEGFLAFDVAIATPDLMAQVGRLGRVLGPRGLMPNPKTGTVTTDIAKAVRRVQGRPGGVPDRSGRQRARPIGKASFDRAQLVENYRSAIDELIRAKPAAAKGRYLRSVTVSSTMGPGVRIDPAKARIIDEVLARQPEKSERRLLDDPSAAVGYASSTS